MTYRPHVLMTCHGTLPGSEIFSFGIALGRADPLDNDWLDNAAFQPDATVWDDLRDDCAAFFSGAEISPRAVLTTVKFAWIGANGRYTKSPVERAVGGGSGVPGGGTGTAHPPNQVACAVTLHTGADLGRVKGRFYLPMPMQPAGTDGRMSEPGRDLYESQAQTFINNINNQPGLDVLDIRVVVASQGRKNLDGSVRLAHDNHLVNAVSVGRTLDTIRRRRNKVTELRGTPSPVG